VRRSTLALVLLGSISACRAVDEKKLALLQDEIATLGSAAKVAGPRSPSQIQRIDSDVKAAQRHIDDLAR